MSREEQVSNAQIKKTLDELVLLMRFMRNSFDALAKNIEESKKHQLMVQAMDNGIADLRGRLETMTPILEVLLHDRIKPGFKSRLVGRDIEEVPPTNPTGRPWPPPVR